MTTLKRDYITCHNRCGRECHAEYPWKWTVDAENICMDCFDEGWPTYTTGEIEKLDGGHFASIDFRGEEICTGFYRTEADAEERINEMCKRMWGKSPIEDK